MTTTAKSLKSLCRGVRLTSTYGSRLDYNTLDDWQKSATPYTCTLRYQGRQMTFDYFMGRAHEKEPTVHDCLDCLLSDAQAGSQPFDDFCSEFGYDQDSRKVEKIHKSCVQMNAKLRRLLGDDYEMFQGSER